MEINTIAKIHTDFGEKFGIPRQSGIVGELTGEIVFEPEYRNPDMLRGLEDFDWIWVIWQFSGVPDGKWTPLVRPPKLGGNEKKGVFATRSPFRPNPIGLSSLKLLKIDNDRPDGPVLIVSGVDMLDGTPILDIKPYVPYADSHPQAREGFAKAPSGNRLKVEISDELLQIFPKDKRAALIGVLSQDPRPGYQDDPERVYGMNFAGKNVRFKVADDVLTVLNITA